MYTTIGSVRIACLLGAVAGCALLAGNVCARDKIVTESYKVDTQGLDPSRPADAQTLYTRVTNAAWFVCVRGWRADLLPVDGRKRGNRCCRANDLSPRCEMVRRLWSGTQSGHEAFLHQRTC